MTLNLTDIPEWDGHKHTAIDYFSDMRRLINSNGNGPEFRANLAKLMIFRWQKGSALVGWWDALQQGIKDAFQADALLVLDAVRSRFLGQTWRNWAEEKIRNLRYQQNYHQKESPTEFFHRKLAWLRVVLQTHLIPARVELDMLRSNTPECWSAWIHGIHLGSVSDLFTHLQTVEKVLQDSYKSQGGLGNLPLIQDLIRKELASENRRRRPMGREVRAVERESTQSDSDSADLFEDPASVEADDSLSPAEAYAVIKHRVKTGKYQAPAGGYPFPKAANQTQQKNAPPNPCLACGGPHWNRECPHYEEWKTKYPKPSSSSSTSKSVYFSFTDGALHDCAFEGTSADDDPHGPSLSETGGLAIHPF